MKGAPAPLPLLGQVYHNHPQSQSKSSICIQTEPSYIFHERSSHFSSGSSLHTNCQISRISQNSKKKNTTHDTKYHNYHKNQQIKSTTDTKYKSFHKHNRKYGSPTQTRAPRTLRHPLTHPLLHTQRNKARLPPPRSGATSGQKPR